MNRVSSYLPGWVREPVRGALGFVQAIPYHGKGRYCPVCGNQSRMFRTYGVIPREDAMCPHCSALERHRFIWLYFNKRTDLFDGRTKEMLHVAPEMCLAHRLKAQLGKNYITADLIDPQAMVRMDITDIHFPDNSFDVIYCSHVLEHVPDDRKAMQEFHRVLKPSGWAILLVPITTDKTIEDPSIIDPKERLRLFGQEDHVRRYGPDYIDRLREAGFKVTVTTVNDLTNEDEAFSMGLTRESGDIYFCKK